MVVAVVIGVLLAIGSFVALAAPTFTSDTPGTLWGLLLVLPSGVATVCLGMVRGRARSPRTLRRAQLEIVAGTAFFCTCVAIVLVLLAGYEGKLGVHPWKITSTRSSVDGADTDLR
jgi:hypothetical protein